MSLGLNESPIPSLYHDHQRRFCGEKMSTEALQQQRGEAAAGWVTTLHEALSQVNGGIIQHTSGEKKSKKKTR